MDTCAGRNDASLEEKIDACSSLIDVYTDADKERLAILYTTRGAYWRARAELSRAEADQTEAIRLQPGSALLYFNRAVTAQARENYDGALTDLTRAIELAPRFHLAYRARGGLHYGRGSFADAAQDYSKVLDLSPKDAHALTMRGLSKWQRGDAQGGRDDITAALRIGPATTVALVAAAKPSAGAVAAASPAPELPLWEYNRSQVTLESEGARLRFRYEVPRPELQMAGIRSGTQLFEGTTDGDRISGTIYVFSRKCGTRGYDVSGYRHAGTVMSTITLSGRRPLVDRDCKPNGKFETASPTFTGPGQPSAVPPQAKITGDPPPQSDAPPVPKKQAAIAKGSRDGQPDAKPTKTRAKNDTDAPRTKSAEQRRTSDRDGSATCDSLKSIAGAPEIKKLLGC